MGIQNGAMQDGFARTCAVHILYNIPSKCFLTLLLNLILLKSYTTLHINVGVLTV